MSSGDQDEFCTVMSGGWTVVEEPFVKDRLKWFEKSKFSYSNGEGVNDLIKKNDQEVRYTYLSDFGDMSKGWNFGDDLNPNAFTGMHYSQVASHNLSWEVAKKHNLGMDISVLNGKYSLTADVFKDTRENIFMERHHL